jgi:hypothetical protein
MHQSITHNTLIAKCLERVGERSILLGFRLLSGGVSGARTYRLRLGSGSVVLKVTPADSPRYQLERSAREMAFFFALAPRIPLRVPRLLGAYEDDDLGVCLLLAAHRPIPAADWREADYLAVAGELAGFHAAFWGQTDTLADHVWLRRPDPQARARDIAHARESWRTLAGLPHLGGVLDGATCAWVAGLLEHEDDIEDALTALPFTLCHGDCHAGNLLRATDGNLVWADWQEVGVGPGPGDLSFFFQRAPSGGELPHVEAMIQTYRRALEAATGERVAAETLRRVLAADELRTRVLYWPDYLAQATAEQLAGMVGRMRELAATVGMV